MTSTKCTYDHKTPKAAFFQVLLQQNVLTQNTFNFFFFFNKKQNTRERSKKNVTLTTIFLEQPSIRCAVAALIRKQKGCRCFLPFMGPARRAGRQRPRERGARGLGPRAGAAPAPAPVRCRTGPRCAPTAATPAAGHSAGPGARAVVGAGSRGGTGAEGAGAERTRARGERGTRAEGAPAASAAKGRLRPCGQAEPSERNWGRCRQTPAVRTHPVRREGAGERCQSGARQAPRHRAALRGSAAKRSLRGPIGLP